MQVNILHTNRMHISGKGYTPLPAAEQHGTRRHMPTPWIHQTDEEFIHAQRQQKKHGTGSRNTNIIGLSGGSMSLYDAEDNHVRTLTFSSIADRKAKMAQLCNEVLKLKLKNYYIILKHKQ